MTQELRVPELKLRSCRILLAWGMCVLLTLASGTRLASQQTPQQQQQDRERQQELERQREEQQREQEQERQRQQQQEQRREEQQRQQEQQRQREQAQEQERQRQQQQQEQQQREQEQQRQQQQMEQQRQREEQRQNQERLNQQRPGTPMPQRQEPPDPQLRARPVNPEPIQPTRVPEAPPMRVVGPEGVPVPNSPLLPVHPPVRPEHGPEVRPEPGFKPIPAPEFHRDPVRPDIPRPIRPVAPVVPEHGLDPVRRDPPHRDGHPTVVVVGPAPRPVVVVRPTTEVILGLAPPPRRPVVVVAPTLAIGASTPAQTYAAAQAHLQAAQASCAQADAYQNYVNSVINNQNNLSQGMDQILQTIADNTSDPDAQNAILGAIGQPNPINDSLQQQLQAQASTYESVCQTRLTAAQAAMPPDPSQQSAPGATAQPGAAAAAPLAAMAVPPGQQAPAQAPASAQQPQPQAAPAARQACTSDVTMALPQPRSPWGSWVPLGNTGLVFGVSRVNATTLTWRFFNAGSQTVASMNFNYNFTDADTGQPTTQSDLLPYALAPGQSVGGWAAYAANTRGNVSLQITQIACQ